MTPRRFVKALPLAACLLMGCAQPLLEDLREPEANELVTELGLAGLRGTKSKGSGGRFAVLVAPGDHHEAWRVAKAAGFPRTPEPSAPQRLVLGPTEAESLARRRQAAGLASLLRQRETVVDARVVLDSVGAAVLVRVRPSVEVDREAIRKVVRVGAGLADNAEVRVEVSVIDHGAPSKNAPSPQWPLVLAVGTALFLAAMCLFLVLRLRRARRDRHLEG